MSTSRQKKSSTLKYRTAVMRVSLILGAAAVLLCLSIAASLFDFSVILSGPGNFFVRSYGGLAFLIPAYLIYAAFILADPRYRPDKIFFLAGFTLPFITVALGCYIIRDFDYLVIKSLFLARAGKLGIGFIFALVTGAEAVLIILLRSVLFFPNGSMRLFTGEKQKKADQKERKIAGLLPAPKRRKLKDIYTASAAMAEPPAAGSIKTAEQSVEEPKITIR